MPATIENPDATAIRPFTIPTVPRPNSMRRGASRPPAVRAERPSRPSAAGNQSREVESYVERN
jgi:hypothetical protein